MTTTPLRETHADASVIDFAAHRDRRRQATGALLSDRERLILTELAIGNSTRGTAASVHLSPHTVRSHVKSALRKLGAQTRPQAVAIAIARGEIDVTRALERGGDASC